MSRLAALKGSSFGDPPNRLLWAPSQKGALPVCLQPQKSISSSVAAAVNFTGAKSVPLCEPSQKG
jgi:hypothetical protein